MKPLPRCPIPLVLALAILLPLAVPATAAPAPDREGRELKRQLAAAEEALAEPYRQWLDEVAVLITDEERQAFLQLTEDYHRDAFIEEFWRSRDPYSDTARNEFRLRWERKVAEARQRFGTLGDVRAEIFLLNGPAALEYEVKCSQLLWPTEIWFYQGSEQTGEILVFVFYQRWAVGDWRIWSPGEGLEALAQQPWGVGRGDSNLLGEIYASCYQGDEIAGLLSLVLNMGELAYTSLLIDATEKPEPPRGEWVKTFAAYSTDVPEDAELLKADFELLFPGRRQSRTLVQGVLTVATAEAGQVVLGEHRSYNFVLTAEVLADGKLFDSFRNKFDFPDNQVAGDVLPMVFERALRPGDYRLVAKLEDLNSGKLFRLDRAVTVPEVDGTAPPPLDPETAQMLAEANAVIADGEVSLKLSEPGGELLSGMHRFEAEVAGGGVDGGGIDKVTFYLDNKSVLTKRRPPFSVELDLGDLPRTRTLRAAAYDTGGHELASDELLINSGGHRFQVRLVEPTPTRRYVGSLRARAEVETPDDRPVERVEFFLNETRVATLYQPPFVQPIVLPQGGSVAYVQAVAYLPDGNSTQDLVFINAPDLSEEVSIEYVELYTTVYDRADRPVTGLARADFAVSEDGVPQQIQRFEVVRDLPIHTAVLLDISASMEERLAAARDAALAFIEQSVKPKDRACVITFNDRPYMEVKFTNDTRDLAGGLAGLKAERGTALWDSVIFGLHYFNGIKGQRAMLVLSDGDDESSRFGFDEALEYARRAGVTVYAIGLDLPKAGARKLTRLADETGGRSFFVDTPEQLGPVYAAIEEELRSQYLITYQSTNTDPTSDFRVVEVELAPPGLEAKTLRGYYPG